MISARKCRHAGIAHQYNKLHCCTFTTTLCLKKRHWCWTIQRVHKKRHP